jgi:hypothetical protein
MMILVPHLRPAEDQEVAEIRRRAKESCCTLRALIAGMAVDCGEGESNGWQSPFK